MKHFFVAGFDFGTSYSKVVIQDQNTRIQKVVTLGDEFGALFPSCVYAGEDWISGPEGEYEGVLVTYPKLIAADAASKKSVFHDVTFGGYQKAKALLGITDAQRFVRLILTRYFLSVINGIHRFIRNDDDWHGFDPATDPLVVQIAVPTGLMDSSDGRTELVIRECLMAASIMHDPHADSESWSFIDDLSHAIDGIANLSAEDRHDLEERCITYPEVAAGVQPILQSRNVRDGKYITLDVGAGTVDLNAFHRWTRDAEHNSLDYWACQVAPLGFARLSYSGRRHGRSDHEIAVNPMNEKDLILKLEGVIRKLMHQAFTHQPYKTAGNGPSPWAGETYAYIWGGGAQHSAYEECLLKVLGEFQIGIHVINRLPRPNNDLVLPSGADFGRFAIAFGLSYYHVNLKEIRLPSTLESFAQKYGFGTAASIVRKKKTSGTVRDCACQGINPSCARCDGKGFYEV